MNDLIDIGALHVNGYVIFAFLLIACLYLLRKISRGIFDPWFPLVFNQIVLLFIVTYLYVIGLLNFSDYWYWIGGTLAIFLPLLLQKRQFFYPERLLVTPAPQSFLDFLKWLGTFVCVYQLVFDVVFVVNRGLPVLSEYGSNPQIYIGGFGIVKYIHDSTKLILPPIATLILFSAGNKKLYLYLMVSSIYPSLLFEWSKVGLITVVASYWISYLCFFGYTTRLLRFTRLAFLAAGLFVLFMFSRVAASGYGNGTFDAILLRVIDTADSIYMYYILDARRYIPPDFSFAGYAFSLVAPFFSTGYQLDTIGHVIQSGAYISTEDGFGPSPPAQIVGNIFFGSAGIFYCLIVGIFLRFIRRKLTCQNPITLTYILILYSLMATLAGDFSLFFYYIFISLFVTPPIFAAFLAQKLFRRPKRNLKYA